MFRKLGPNSAQNNTGFLVKIDTKNSLRYKEERHELIIEIEILLDRYDFVIYTSSITHWQPPYENEVIAKEKKQQIIQRICDALDFLEIKYILE